MGKRMAAIEAKDRERALSLFVADEKVPLMLRTYVADERKARERISDAEWGRLGPDERRARLAQEVAEANRPWFETSPSATPTVTPLVEVRRYRSSAEFEADAQVRALNGWTLAGQSQEPGRGRRMRGAANGAILGSLVMFPKMGAVVGAASAKRSEGPITVTWVRK